jgi:hypothetical protein
MATTYSATGTCTVLAGSDPTTDATFDSFTDNNGHGLQITYNSPNSRSGSCSGQPTLIVKNYCDSSQSGIGSPNVDDTTNTCTPLITFQNKTGCKKGSLSALWQWFSDNKWVMFSVFLIVGFLICFLGRTLFRPVIFIAGVLLSVSLIWIIFYSTFLNENSKGWVGWVVLAGAILFGLIIGCLLIKFVKIGAFVLAAWGGYALGLLLWNAFLYKTNSNGGLWGFTIGFALVFGVLALFFFDHILIHATAILGSFMVINGIGQVAGRYQNPFTIADEINSGVIDKIDPVFYAYMAGNLVLYVMGMMFQYRQRRKDKVTGNDPYSRLR